MADTSSDEAFVERIARALHDARLEAIVIGATAAVLQGAPVTTQDVVLLVRRTKKNELKLNTLCLQLGLGRISITSDIDALVGPIGHVDIVFDAIPPNLGFESVRSRAVRMNVG